jgi:T5SS/PEP-CTERM-associated repeat protein
MRIKSWSIVPLIVAFALGASTARAQFTANFQTNIISGVRSNWAGFGAYNVGSNTFFDTLIIQNGGALSNFDGIIGNLGGASNNTAIVTDPGSTWTNYDVLVVGSSAPRNSLVISNGGLVYALGGTLVGYALAASSNNTVTVTGAGSVWTNIDLYVGYAGGHNRMTISGGGAVRDRTGFIGEGGASVSNVVIITDPGSLWSHDAVGTSGGGQMVFGDASVGNQLITSNGGAIYSSSIIFGNNTASASNSATITGAGSTWYIAPGVGGGGLEVGNGGPGSQLTISDGGAVHVTHGIIGFAGKNDKVTVTGAGAVWDDMVDLTVGSNGKTNTLTIGPGGAVTATNLYISYLAGSVGNHVDVEGGTMFVTTLATIGNLNCSSSGTITVDTGYLIVTNAAHNALLEVLNGTLALNGGTTIVDRLEITNACARFAHAGGTLIVGSYVFDTNKFRSTAVTPSSNDVLLTWMMGLGATNALQAAAGNANGGYTTNAFTDIFVVTNNSAAGTITNYLDVGGATNKPARYYRVRLVP